MSLTLSRGRLPYSTPPAGAPLRLAFVGQGTFFEACAQTQDTSALATRYVEFRQDGDAERMLASVRAWAPHVVLVFRPEIVPRGLFEGLDAATVGFLTEPLPRTGRLLHRDLGQRLDQLRKVDAGNFDRIVAFDPKIVPAAEEVLPVWRSLPLPVDDRFFAAPALVEGRPRVMFVGRSTAHREQLLTPS